MSQDYVLRDNVSGGYDALLKVVLVGDASVGKTSLVKRITNEPFNPKEDFTIGVEFGAVLLTMRNNEKVKLQIWDTAGDESFHSIAASYYRGAAIFCIVVDATNNLSDEKSKRGQINKYLMELKNHVGSTEPFIIVIENKSDLHGAVRMTDSEFKELEQLGISRQNYVYASAKLDQTDRGITITACLTELTQAYIDAHPEKLRKKPDFPAARPAVHQAETPSVFSLAWWARLFSSPTPIPIEFRRAEEARARIAQFSSEEAVIILRKMHAHLKKGNADHKEAKPFELTIGGGDNFVTFIDKGTGEEITCDYQYNYPDNVTRWLSICCPYVLYKNNLAEVYVNTAKDDLLYLFNDIIETVGNMKPSYLRYQSTEAFYKAMPAIFGMNDSVVPAASHRL